MNEEEKVKDLDKVYKDVEHLSGVLYRLFFEIRDYYDLEEEFEDKLLDLTADAGTRLFSILWVIKQLKLLKRREKSKLEEVK